MQLGCGLIRIGREWGFKKAPIPSFEESQAFLQSAVALGIRFFDTAQAYGSSEERLGAFLKTLSSDVRNSLTIATKCGEIWDEEKQGTIVDHSYDTLVRSIDTSLSLLGKIDILQIHKATHEVLHSNEVWRAIEYARSKGIKRFGASISDLQTAEVVKNFDELSVVQMPFNQQQNTMLPALRELRDHGKYLIINRPFHMGEIVNTQEQKSKQQLLQEAYAFILKENFSGVVLTGTSNPLHLKENLEAFSAAQDLLR